MAISLLYNCVLRLFMLLFMGGVILVGCTSQVYQSAEGGIYGTTYHIVYEYPDDLAAELRGEMERVNASLSMFNKNSVISKLNSGESTTVDSLFVTMFEKAVSVNRETKGAFDITVAPLVNAWGFGFKNDTLLSPGKIDSLLLVVGMDKLSVIDGHLIKSVDGVEMDASAIAKGLGVDLVAEYLDHKGVKNYMVEIGGEVRVKGESDKVRPWKIGIDKPIENQILENRELQMVLNLREGALATSGNYRNFYVRDGKKYAHTIDPRTGYPVQQDILSASVYADNCMTADAYATAFMVLGLEKAKQIVENNPHLDVCFIFEENGTFKNWMSDGFKKLIDTK